MDVDNDDICTVFEATSHGGGFILINDLQIGKNDLISTASSNEGYSIGS